jgi:IgA-specific serine endopeptidase
MTVATVKALFESINSRLRDTGAEAERDQLAQIAEQLQPYAGMAWDVFLAQLAKVKKPAKSLEEKDAEKRAKVELAAKAKEAKKAEADAKKAEEKQRKDAEKVELKKQAETQKAAEKQRKAEEVAAAKERTKLAKEAEKAEAEKQKHDSQDRVARQAANVLQKLIQGFPGGGTSKEQVDVALEVLKPLNKEQLMIVAKVVEADAGLGEKATKAKIAKQIDTAIQRRWKTSHNVLH